MNALSPVAAAAHPVMAEALARLGELARTAGIADWSAPDIPLDAERFASVTEAAGLTRGDALAAALVFAAEANALVARLVAQLQIPVGGARPFAGLVAALFAREGVSVAGLHAGDATRSGLLIWGEEPVPLSERSLAMPGWLVTALAGLTALPPGVAAPCQPAVLVPDRLRRDASEWAQWLAREPAPLLVIRASCPAEGEALARAVAEAMAHTPCRLGNAAAPGLALWLAAMRQLGVVHRSAGPGETAGLGDLDACAAPLVMVMGPDGQVDTVRPRREWTVPMPSEPERDALWQAWGLAPAHAAEAAARYRHSCGRIAEIGRGLAPDDTRTGLEQVADLLQSSAGRIDALARRVNVVVRREDIVLPDALGQGLDRLRDRIRLRHRLHENLGATLAARYRPGVRALFTGASGTGKTLAVHWLAREAGLPCYRVDLSQLTSKWIGETEKNLSLLLDTAEQGDVLLFFDEADSLFGARTDVNDSNDRHANAQTNFLLQRIEDYAGVALLATNSRDRFDPAFVRRLDMVLEFPLPDALARRQLWDRHLGSAHAIDDAQLDRVAATVDLAGGHVRNVVLGAAARARVMDRPIGFADLVPAIEEEYAKLGRSAPTIAAC
jgi:AAA+ superfamily predicted ATPase